MRTEQGHFSPRKTRAVERTNYIPIFFGLKKKNLSMGNCPKRKEVSGVFINCLTWPYTFFISCKTSTSWRLYYVQLRHWESNFSMKINLMENLWRCVILAFTEIWSQVLLAHEIQRERYKVASDQLQSVHRVGTFEIAILVGF